MTNDELRRNDRMANTEEEQRYVAFLHLCFVIDSSFVLRYLQEHEHDQDREQRQEAA